jgi:hypothetical protein
LRLRLRFKAMVVKAMKAKKAAKSEKPKKAMKAKKAMKVWKYTYFYHWQSDTFKYRDIEGNLFDQEPSDAND